MKIEANGDLGLVSDSFKLNSVRVKLADLDASLSEILLPDNGPSRIHVETNTFDLTALTGTLSFFSGYRVTGKGQTRMTVSFGNGPFAADGTVALEDASIAAVNGKLPGLSNLDATIALKGQTIALQPSTFSIASARATAQGVVSSINPLFATYQFDAQSIRPAAFVPSRPENEILNQVHIVGSANGNTSAPQIAAHVTSSSGFLNGASYQNLDLSGSYSNSRIAANPLAVAVFSGFVVADGSMTMDPRSQFNVNANLRNVDLQQAFIAMDPKTQRRLRGLLSGNVRMSGAGKDWNAIKPTLHGSGALMLTKGKIAGVNIVAVAINKIASAPGVSQILSATFMSDHRGMLADPDTELRDARSTFMLADERITTHDLTVKSSDYAITGDGWFDLDNNISMSLDIQLTFGLSVTIPVYVTGHTPVIVVVPDIPKLAERIAMGALSVPGKLISGGVSGLSNLIGGGTSSGSSGASTPPSSNPLDKLKGWLP